MRVSPPAVNLLLLLVACPAFAADWEHEHDFELGYQGSIFIKDGSFTRNRAYGSARHRTSVFSTETPTRWSLDAALRGWVGSENELDLRALSISRADDYTDVQLGFQQIAWGETFGFPIADLVNPRDLRDPFFFEMDWIRRSTLSANVQVMFGSLRLQAVATPIPRNDVLPERGSAFDPFPPILDGVPLAPRRKFPLNRFGRDGEYGGRIGYFFDFGLDLSLLYFHHWNRTPVYEFRIENLQPLIVPIQEPIHSAGLTFSKAFEDWVLRGDTVVHLDTPMIAENLGPSKRVTYVRSVLGADVTTQSDWILGAQVHYDHRGDESLQWVSLRVQKLLFDGDLEPQVFAYLGVDNTDRWLQPRIDWHVLEPWTVSLRGDFIWGRTDKKPGDLGFYNERHRMMLWTSLRL